MAKLSANGKFVTVERGDTLTDIAVEYLNSYDAYKRLATINGLENPHRICIGDTIYLEPSGSSGGSSSSSSSSKVTTSSVSIKQGPGIISNTERTLYVTWSWSRVSQTEKYKVVWLYSTDDGVWFVGSESEKTIDEDDESLSRQSTWNMPDGATMVKVKIKPIPKSDSGSKNSNDASFTANWTVSKIFYSSSLPLSKPTSAPTVKIDGLNLIASLDNIDIDGATGIQFQVVQDNKDPTNGAAFAYQRVDIVAAHASHKFPIVAGSEYKVCYRAYRSSDKEYSDWSPYSDNYKAMPAAPSGINNIRATSETSVYLEWGKSATATGYEIQYTTESRYFDSSSEVTSITDAKNNYWEVTGLTSGDEYFFRVRAVDEDSNDKSAWTDVKSVVVGSTPAAPTTWSSTTTAIIGEPLNLYWVHNSKDGSTQTLAELKLYFDGSETPVSYTFDNDNTVGDSVLTYVPLTEEEREDGKTNFCSIKTSSFEEGKKVEWWIRTAGITSTYSDWSIRRTVDVYAPATLELKVTDASGNEVDILKSYPFNIQAVPGPPTQSPISYHVSIASNETYETLDNVGNTKVVNAGETVYSKHFDVTVEKLFVELSAGDLDLENGISYTITCTVSMNSGLTAEQSKEFQVEWQGVHYSPNAEIGIDLDTMSATIRPYCEDRKMVYYKVTYENGIYVRGTESFDYVYGTRVKRAVTTDGYKVYSGTTVNDESIYYCVVEEVSKVSGVTLSVYRREFDGTFTEIGSNIDSEKYTSVTDPHPALDYARYRVVAIDNATGVVSYYDLPGYPVNGKAVIIQWNEAWTSFETTIDDELAQPAWSGSMLTLPYNINVSESNNRDVSLVEYVGQENPTSYYGTQQGYRATWNLDIDKSDKETLYALRRLQRWMGDVYVREPSGTGYWASVSVSFNQQYSKMTIPVTIDINKVEGGM